MASSDARRALVLVDLINEIIAPEGKLAAKGYAAYDARHGSLDRVQKLLRFAREEGHIVIHVGLGFSPDYKEQPPGSPLFGAARTFGVLRLGDWGTGFHPKVAPLAGEASLVKHRVNAFHGTALDLILRNNRVREVAVVGCATDMAVQSTVRDGHDRDYACTVISDCCMAASDEDHEQTLRLLGKVASVLTLDQYLGQA